MTALKNLLKFILYAGAGLSCLAGLGAIYGVIVSFRYPLPDEPFDLVLAMIYICLAFMPAFMFLKGLKTKAWHWVIAAIVEAIVLAMALVVVGVLIDLSSGIGE